MRCSAKCLTGRRCKKYVSRDGLCSVHCPRESCSVCLEEIKTSVKLECKHTFCEACINTWIIEKSKPCCPNCRASISIDHRYTAYTWGVNLGYLFKAVTHYYNFKLLPEIDAYILMSCLDFTFLVGKFVITDTEFKNMENSLKDNINYYEIFQLLQKTVIIIERVFMTKVYPDKPRDMHVFLF